jgi:hypothetical protein
MDSDKLVIESELKKGSFFEHVFNFEDDSKSEMLNIIQYTVLAIIPIVVLNKTIAKLIPKVDDNKPSFEITLEIIGQAVSLFLGMLLVHRFVTYFPTYSKKPYASLHITNVIIALLVVFTSFQTRIGEKTNILIDRLFDLIDGKTTLGGDKATHSASAPSHPSHPVTSQAPAPPPVIPQHQASRADDNHSGTTNISQLHNNEATQKPNFDSMYSATTTPLVNAQTPSMNQEAFTEPLAANAFGGSLNAF